MRMPGRRGAADVVDEIKLKVREVLPEDSFGGRFNLNPSPAAPRNAFVPLRFLQKQLDLVGKANALLVGSTSINVQESLASSLSLADWNLKLRTPEDRARSFVKILDPLRFVTLHRRKRFIRRARAPGR